MLAKKKTYKKLMFDEELYNVGETLLFKETEKT